MTHLDTPMDALLDRIHGKPRLLVADDQPINIQVMYPVFGGDCQDFIAKPANPAVVRARAKAQLTLKFQSDLMRRRVFLDGLCGVFNRRYFDQQLGGEEFACILPDTAFDDAMGLADLPLYNAKQSGRGWVCGDVLSASADV